MVRITGIASRIEEVLFVPSFFRVFVVSHSGIMVVRRALTRRFPFGVYLIVGERSVSVIGVVHATRNARVWRNRV
jgi:hypothetical protein